MQVELTHYRIMEYSNEKIYGYTISGTKKELDKVRKSKFYKGYTNTITGEPVMYSKYPVYANYIMHLLSKGE
jgi:hypothetical protein